MSDTASPAEAAPASPDEEKAARVDLFITQWVQDCIHGSPAARDTEGYNHLITSAAPELKRRMLREIA